MSVYYFSRGQLTDHLYMLEILERSVTFQDITLQTKVAHQFVNVSLLCPFGVFSKLKRQEAYFELVTNMDMLSNLKIFHEYNLDGSVDVPHSNALLSYGKNVRDVDTFDEWRYTMVMTTDKPATMLPPIEDAFKEHVLRAKFHTFIWCKGHVPNQELIEPVGHSWSACDDGLVTPTMHNLLPMGFET